MDEIETLILGLNEVDIEKVINSLNEIDIGEVLKSISAKETTSAEI